MDKSGTKRINFTVKNLEAVRCPPFADRIYVYDTHTRHLAFCVTNNGERRFYLYYKFMGRPQRYKLGVYPGLTVEQARTAAAIANGKIANGVNPQAEKRAARREATFGEIFTHYLDTHAKLHKRTWREDEAKYRLHLQDWKNRRARDITRHDVNALKARIGKDAPGAANRVLALLSCVFNKAADIIGNHNPTQGVARYPEKQRERFLQGDELPRFFAALKEEPSATMRDFFELCLWTGARRGNVMAMRWENVNLESGVWTIPHEQSKAGHSMMVYLSAKAVEVLKRRQEEQEGAEKPEWVFPAHSASGHLEEPKKAWEALLRRAQLEGVWIHDLRRTLGSWQASTGANLPTIGKSLGHRNIATTAIYSRLNLDPVRQSVDTATAAIMAKVNPEQGKRPKNLPKALAAVWDDLTAEQKAKVIKSLRI